MGFWVLGLITLLLAANGVGGAICWVASLALFGASIGWLAATSRRNDRS